MSQAHQPCPKCGSSDALLINDDGSTKCFSCGEFTPSEESSSPQREAKAIPKEFLKGHSLDIDSRKLKAETCRDINITQELTKARKFKLLLIEI